jgi:hypothetical protein
MNVQTAQTALQGFFNQPEFVEARARREVEREKTRREALSIYGSEKALFADTPNEKALSDAVEPFKEWETWRDETGVEHRYVNAIAGVDQLGRAEKLPWQVARKIREAVPLALTLRGVMAEYQEWQQLYSYREAFCEDGDFKLWVRFRVELLEEDLTKRPAASWDDLEVRTLWWREAIDKEISRYCEDDLQTRIAADVAHLRVTA